MGGFSTVGAAALPNKFPFWSAIITQTRGYVPVPQYAMANVDIRPPPGETWMIDLASAFLGSASGTYLKYNDFDGSTARQHFQYSASGYDNPRLSLTRILTNSLYARLTVYNNGSGNYLYYGYSGFKLSQPLWAPKKLNGDFKPFKRSTTLPLPSSIKALNRYKCEVLGIVPDKPEDYGLAVVLEEDKPLAVDPETNFPVERLSAYVQADVLADFIAKFKAKTADPVTTGYYKYIRKWLDEGIDLGISI